MKLSYTLFILLSFFVSETAFSQYTFDQCKYAKFIDLNGSYCSEYAEYSNVGATPDPKFSNGCVSLTFENGVWFSFIPTKTAASIRVFGRGLGGTMENPKILIFEECDKFLSCSPGNTPASDELVVDNLIIGKTYYVMIESRIGGEGSFKICVDDFTPVPSPESDCEDGVVLCDKSSFLLENLVGAGKDRNEIDPSSCIQVEFASSWYKWTCEKSGDLSFVLTPNNNDLVITDDLDFAVYELPNGIDDCTGKIMIRCMASGANTEADGSISPLNEWALCNGKTGLRKGEKDTNEEGGCVDNSNNYIAPIQMESGKSYVLIVNNYSRSGLGFKIDFGGSGTFLGPDADFEAVALDEFECDKTIRFTNKSNSKTDSITDYIWSFGNGANPINSNNKGPIDVIYDSFGDKIVGLTIKSSRGCLVTKLLPINVESCCADMTLDIDGEKTDPVCADDKNGTLLGKGKEGNPPYMFSVDGSNFQTIPIFYDLGAGNYFLYIQDKKGCRDSIDLSIVDPERLLAKAGPDKTIDLGDHTKMNGDYLPPEYDVTYHWTPNYNIADTSDLTSDVFPYYTQKYTLHVVQDETGCEDEDDMTIFVKRDLQVRIPNVFTPNGDGRNDYFTAYNIKAAINIDEMFIFNRWGELIYKAENIKPGDELKGWDGTFKNQKVNTGVYVYLFMIEFLGGEIFPYSGDITLLR